MQQACWISTTPVGITIPDWIGVWFSVFPNIQECFAQAAAALLVLGFYAFAQYVHLVKVSKTKNKF